MVLPCSGKRRSYRKAHKKTTFARTDEWIKARTASTAEVADTPNTVWGGPR